MSIAALISNELYLYGQPHIESVVFAALRYEHIPADSEEEFDAAPDDFEPTDRAQLVRLWSDLRIALREKALCKASNIAQALLRRNLRSASQLQRRACLIDDSLDEWGASHEERSQIVLRHLGECYVLLNDQSAAAQSSSLLSSISKKPLTPSAHKSLIQDDAYDLAF